MEEEKLLSIKRFLIDTDIFNNDDLMTIFHLLRPNVRIMILEGIINQNQISLRCFEELAFAKIQIGLEDSTQDAVRFAKEKVDSNMAIALAFSLSNYEISNFSNLNRLNRYYDLLNTKKDSLTKNFYDLIIQYIESSSINQIDKIFERLLVKKGFNQAKKQFESGEKFTFIEIENDISIRLSLLSDKIIVEILSVFLNEDIEEKYKNTSVQFSLSNKYFKTIGYYKKNNNLFFNKIDFFIIGEFEDNVEELMIRKKLNKYLSVKKLSLEENVVIGAFSVDTCEKAKRYNETTTFKINGVYGKIIISHEGYPEFHIDPSYGLANPVGIYPTREFNTINPSIFYKDIFDELLSSSLLGKAKPFFK